LRKLYKEMATKASFTISPGIVILFSSTFTQLNNEFNQALPVRFSSFKAHSKQHYGFGPVLEARL